MNTYCPKHHTGCGPCYCNGSGAAHKSPADLTLTEAALRSPLLFPFDYPRVLLDMAWQISRAAACMDCLLNNPAAEDRAAAPAHIAALQLIAEQLAGEHVDEIYPPEEVAELKIEEPA